MNNKERLLRLQKLKVERKDGPLFKSSNECMEWIDNVAPLLKYNENHYKIFTENAQYVRITTLSADRLMSHLNLMLGVLNQAIIELENKITSPQPIPSRTPTPTSNKPDYIKPPDGISLRHFAFGVGVVIFAALAIWSLNHYFDLGLI